MPLAEHDGKSAELTTENLVSIHVPLAEHDITSCLKWTIILAFQFTCPSRSTTILTCGKIGVKNVSIHVPLAEHDDNIL